MFKQEFPLKNEHFESLVKNRNEMEFEYFTWHTSILYSQRCRYHWVNLNENLRDGCNTSKWIGLGWPMHILVRISVSKGDKFGTYLVRLYKFSCACVTKSSLIFNELQCGVSYQRPAYILVVKLYKFWDSRITKLDQNEITSTTKCLISVFIAILTLYHATTMVRLIDIA